MTLQQALESKKQNLILEKHKLQKQLSKMPEGRLIFSRSIVRNKPYYKWYVSTSSGRRYIPKKDRQFARELAKKKLRTKRLSDVEAELNAIDSYLKKHREGSELEAFLESPPFFCLLADTEKVPDSDLSKELERWANEEYETNPFYPERRNIPAVNGLMVRSKTEAFIVMLLVSNKIPFRYECKIELDGEILYPDFLIRHPVTGEYYYWEHFGLLEDQVYRSHYFKKMRLYMNNGILPDSNLILTYESLSHPFNLHIAEDKIKEFFLVDTESAKSFL